MQLERSNIIGSFLCGLIIFLIVNRVIGLYETVNISETTLPAIYKMMEVANVMFEPPYKIFMGNAFLYGSLSGLLMLICLPILTMGKRTKMTGKEHGSARWGKKRDIKPYMNEDFSENIIFTKTERLTMLERFSKKRKKKYERNKNILIVGGSGSGKTYFYATPNLMQMHSSYVLTDPKGTLLSQVGKMFAENKYIIKTFNIKDMDKSLRYNPFAYIKSETDILILVSVIMENTTGKGSGGDEFWVKAERLWLQAHIGYLWEEYGGSGTTFSDLIYLLKKSVTKEEDEDYKNAVDILFEDLEEWLKKKGAPESFSCASYKDYKLAAGKTAKSILISISARLAAFNIPALKELTSKDELSLDKIGDEKTLFVCVNNDTDNTYNFLMAMVYTQMFNQLVNKADNEGGELKNHVRFILDEFYNIGKIPNFDGIISFARSRRISITIILQSLAQIKTRYKDEAEGIIDNCDSFLFLGGQSEETTKKISARLGKATIETSVINETKGSRGSISVNRSLVGRDLLTPDEIGLIPRDEAILMISGVPPFKSKKYNPEDHPMYEKLGKKSKEGSMYEFDRSKEATDETHELNEARRELDAIEKEGELADRDQVPIVPYEMEHEIDVDTEEYEYEY